MRGRVGTIVLHLLLVPGTAFLIGGSDIRHQTLRPHHANLNHSLLLVGYVPSPPKSNLCPLMRLSVLAIMLPTALFSTLDQGADSLAEESATAASELVSDATAGILHISRGIAVILLVV